MAAAAAAAGRARGWLRHGARRSAAAVLLWGALLARAAEEKALTEKIQGKLTMLWPIHFSSFPLSTPGVETLETPEFGAELADIGHKGFQEYLAKTLPEELGAEPAFAAAFRDQDHSRVNLAFRRWQQRVFADRYDIPLEGVNTWGPWGETTPRLDGINYSWPALYENPNFRKLRSRIVEVAKIYLKRTGYKEIPAKFAVFIWVEVYGQGDSLSPRTRMEGAYTTGRYFARTKKGTLKFNFEDPRGINPPFGKTYSHPAYQGNIVVFPNWVSHFITPNMQNHTTVCYSFTVHPADLKPLHWSKDLSAQVKVEKNFTITHKRKAPQR